jgi:peroxiredoxin
MTTTPPSQRSGALAPVDSPDPALAGHRFPDLELPDHTGSARRLSGIASGDPLILVFSRGWWCPKEQRYLRQLVGLQDELEVAYVRLAIVSIDPPEVQAAFRAGLGARFVFLSDAERQWLPQLGLVEHSDTIHSPYRPTVFALHPDLTIHRAYNGYWYVGRARMDELREDARAITASIRTDWSLE